MKPANTASQNGQPNLFISLHKLLGTEVALDIYLSTIEEMVATTLLPALKAECMGQRTEITFTIGKLAEFLSNTNISIKVAAAFMDGTDVIQTIQRRLHLQQPAVPVALTCCHVAVVDMINTECLSFYYPGGMHLFLLQTLLLHERMESNTRKFINKPH